MKLLNEYLRETYGCKVYKLSLSAKVTCPNRDGPKRLLVAPQWSGAKKRVLNAVRKVMAEIG